MKQRYTIAMIVLGWTAIITAQSGLAHGTTSDHESVFFGKVYNAWTGDLIPLADITFVADDGDTYGTISHKDGSYAIESLYPVDRVTVTAANYVTLEQPCNPLPTDAPLDLYLEPITVLTEVVIVGYKVPLINICYTTTGSAQIRKKNGLLKGIFRR